MTVPQFSRPGAIDLSALRRPATPAASRAGAPGAAGSYAFDVVGEQALRTDVVEKSMSVVVLVSFWSADAPASVEINATLSALADEFAGRFLFARVDVGAQPELAAALRIPQVPLVVAALRGQLAPLMQDPLPEAEMRLVLDQVLQAAAANGVAGVAEPVVQAMQDGGLDDDLASEPESRYPEAEEALLAGDLEAAIEGYSAALQSSPGDAEATVGLARAQLLKRTSGVDAAAARANAAAAPDDVGAQTLVADLDLLGGHIEDAFARLIELVRRTGNGDRDTARKHLVELFGVVGDEDPLVVKARQQLASALF
jgi:putative thioredoxin